jgi:hypothetical protein
MKLPAELNPADVTAIVDTREQLPFDLAPLGVMAGTLAAGDYSVRGLEHLVAIERKSLSDLIACCGTERERFERELQRLLAYPTRCVIVEASWHDLNAGGWRSQLPPASAVGSVISWIGQGTPFLFAGDRASAQHAAAKLLYSAARRRYREIRTLLAPVEEGAAT